MRDGPYLLVVLFLLSVVLSVLFRVAWRTLGQPKHARTWSLAFAVGAVGYLLNALGAVPHLASPLYVVLISVPTLIVSYLGTLGYRQRAGLPAQRLWFGLGFGLTLGDIFWFNFVTRNDPLRVSVIPMFAAVMLFLAAKAVATPLSRGNVQDRLAWWFLVVFGCFELVLFVLALRLGPKDHAAALMAYNTTLFLGVPSLYVANGLIGMFVLTSDLARQMETLAETDTLTGLLNRRGIERAASERIAEAHRKGLNLAVVLADLDHFKRINDEHGHGVGDVALSRFSEYLIRTAPAGTRVGRLGGEEFVLLLPDANPQTMPQVIERVREGVAGILLAEYDVAPFTASFGLTYLEANDVVLGDLLRRADLALYQAKQTGRNRVCLYDESQTPLHVPRSSRRPAPRV